MGFRTGAYAKLWKIEPGNGNYSKVRLSTSRKNKNTGEYEQDFSGFVNFVGNANAALSRIHEGDRVRLGDVEVTRRWDKDQQKEYTNFTCFSFETADSPQGGSSSASPASPAPADSNPADGSTEEDPF